MACKKMKRIPQCETCQYYAQVLNSHCETEEQLRCAMSIVDLGIWNWDLTSNQITVSDEVYKIVGIKPEAFNGTLAYITDHIIHSNSKEYFLESLQKDLNNGMIQMREYRVNHENKPECWVRVNGRVLYDDENNPSKLLGTVLDITTDHLTNHTLRFSLDFLESLIEALPNPIFYKDAAGFYRYCNAAFLNYLGLTSNQIINKSVYDIAPHALAIVYDKADKALLASKGNQTYEANVKYADGTLRDVIFSKAVHLDKNQDLLGIVGIMQDITEKKTIERQLSMLHQIKDVFLEINHQITSYITDEQLFSDLLPKLQSIFTASQLSTVLELSDDSRLTVFAQTGYQKKDCDSFALDLTESFIWKDVNGTFAGTHIVNDIDSYRETGFTRTLTALSGEEILSTLIVPISINGKHKWFFCFDSLDNHVYTESDCKVADFISAELPLLYRIFELYNTTLQLSRYDSLTGLINRSYFEILFEDRLLLSERKGEQLMIVLFDLNGLKSINDQYGHQAGDQYLKAFSAFITAAFRVSDSFSRIGGDEFIGLFDQHSTETLSIKLKELQDRFKEQDIFSESIIFRGAFSYGMATYPLDAHDKNRLFKIADQNMYLDKEKYKKSIRL